MELRMKTVSKSIDLAVTSRSVPELSSPDFSPCLPYLVPGTVLLFWSNILAARQEHTCSTKEVICSWCQAVRYVSDPDSIGPGTF